MSVTVQKTLKHENLKCSECKKYLSSDIYRCGYGCETYICDKCVKVLADKHCKMCNNKNKFILDFTLQDLLKPHIIRCRHNGCPKSIFTWDTQHLENCLYKPKSCPLCKCNLDIGSIISIVKHFENGCDTIAKCSKINTNSFKIKYKVNKSLKILSINNSLIIIVYFKDNAYQLSAISNHPTYANKFVEVNNKNKIKIEKSYDFSFGFSTNSLTEEQEEYIMFTLPIITNNNDYDNINNNYNTNNILENDINNLAKQYTDLFFPPKY